MPILWRYLLSHFLKVFFLCVGAFVAILLTMRLDEIAYFATLGPEAAHIFWFVAQQIPYIIPIALPISALISAILLMQNLSHSQELTSMRACGYALRDILAPVLAASLFLSALNFYVISELSTTSHLKTGMLKDQLRSINPLLLMHNKHIMQIKGFYFDTLGPSRVGDFSRDVVFFSSNKQNRLNMMVAKELQAGSQHFIGDQVTLLSSQISDNTDPAEHLILENIKKTSTTIREFSQMFEKKIWKINNDHLRLSLLLIRLEEAGKHLNASKYAPLTKEDFKKAKYAYNRILNEISRRFSVGLAVFSFTLMGLAFGITISRNQSSRGIFTVVILGAIYLISFFIAKGFDHALLAATLLYLLPNLLICLASLWMLKRVANGIE